MTEDFDPIPFDPKTLEECAHEFGDASTFKAVVEQHKSEGWANLPLDAKGFICTYIRDGYSVGPMITRGCPQEEALAYYNDPIIKAAIADVSEQYAAINTFSVTGWRAKLTRALEMSLGEIPRPYVTKDGRTVSVRTPDLPTAARLLEIAAKYRDVKEEPKEAIFERHAPLPWEPRQVAE